MIFPFLTTCDFSPALQIPIEQKTIKPPFKETSISPPLITTQSFTPLIQEIPTLQNTNSRLLNYPLPINLINI